MSHDSTGRAPGHDPERPPTLPSLDPGLHLVDVDERATGTVQSLAVDHVLTGPSATDAVWVDSNGVATTTSLARLVPGRRFLERIHVARAFTPYQHHSLVSTLPEVVSDDTSIVVVPELEFHYRSPDVRFGVARDLVTAGVETLRGLAHDRGVPILTTREATTPLSRPLVEAADSVLECELTRFGPRFVGGGFETLVYPVEGGFQTTLSYWAAVLSARLRAVQTGEAPTSRSVPVSASAEPASSSGREVTVGGTD